MNVALPQTEWRNSPARIILKGKVIIITLNRPRVKADKVAICPPLKGKKAPVDVSCMSRAELSSYLNSETFLFRNQQPAIMYIGLCLIYKPWEHTEFYTLGSYSNSVATKVVPKELHFPLGPFPALPAGSLKCH